MKKTVSLILAALLALSVCVCAASAADSVNIFVTIDDENGAIALARKAVTVTDVDGDGSLTVNDALITAHDKYYKGGAAAGYKTDVTIYGLAITLLWGGGKDHGFGYFINNNSCWSLSDTVAEGDDLVAFVYTDTKNYSDAYCFFDAFTVESKQYETVDLALSYYTYDANFNTVKTALEGATITIDGKATKFKTDAEGKVTVEINGRGEHVISATAPEGLIISAPVCVTDTVGASVIEVLMHFINVIVNFFKGLFK